jgi:hypothetical protein
VGVLVAAGAFAARGPLVEAIFAGATSHAANAIETAPPAVASPPPVMAVVVATPTSTEADVVDAQAPPVASAGGRHKARKRHAKDNSTETSQEIDVGF